MARFSVQLIKEHIGETYVVIYESEYRGEALRTLGRWAGDIGLRFNWYDAAAMAGRIRQQADKEKLCRGR